MNSAVGMKVLALLIALQLGIAGIGVATVQGDSQSTGADSDGAATGQGAVATVPGGGPAPSAPGDPSATGQPAPGGPPAAAGGGSPVDRGQPPRPGTYRFRSQSEGYAGFSSSTTRFSGEQESSYRYEAATGGPGDSRVRKHSVDESPEDDGVDFSGYEEYSWRGDGTFLLTEVSEFRRSRDGQEPTEERRECDWQPDVPVYRFPLQAGAEWSWESKCTRRDGDSEETRTRTGTARVTGVREHAVGGREVLAWVIERQDVQMIHTRFNFPAPGGNESRESTSRFESNATDLFAPAVGLEVRSEGRQKSESDGFSEDTRSSSDVTSTTELVSLDPT